MDSARFDSLARAVGKHDRRSVLGVVTGLFALKVTSTASAPLTQGDGLVAIGGTCTATGDCQQNPLGQSARVNAICADNGFVSDGLLTCCVTGGSCESDGDCCGEHRCIGVYGSGFVCRGFPFSLNDLGEVCVTTAECFPHACDIECFEQRCRCNPGSQSRTDTPLDYPLVADDDAAMKAADVLAAIEYAGPIGVLYHSMHPDAQALIPEQAIFGWYTNEFLHFGEPSPRATKIRFRPWTWEVTGETYPNTAEVATRQVLDDGTVVWGEMFLVKDGKGNWCWFFGKDRQFVAEQIARFVPTDAGAITNDPWGVRFGEPCTATNDCSQRGGPARCVDTTRDGIKQTVCLHGPNASCESDADCYQIEGTTVCVGETRQGYFHGVCRRVEGAPCKITRDCQESLTCLSGRCTHST